MVKDGKFVETTMNSHPRQLGFSIQLLVWMNIHEAIAHNEEVIANSDKKGLSIERETFMLKVIAEELI